jgi:hypothetical protein
MSDFISRPPSDKSTPMGNFFRGGMMPAEARDITALLVIDVRSLNLSADIGRQLEAEVRDFIFERLVQRDDVRLDEAELSNRGALDLSGSVYGFAIEEPGSKSSGY